MAAVGNRGRTLALVGLGVAVVVCAGGAGGVAWLGQKGKHRLAKIVSAEADRNLDADVSVGAIEVDALRRFPRVAFTVRDVSVKNRAPFDGVTLFEAKEVGVALDLFSLLSNDVKIRELRLVDAVVDLRTDAKGRSNTAITGGATKTTEDTASEAYAVGLDHIEVENLEVAYDDATSGTSAVVHDLDLVAKGQATDQGVQFQTEAGIAALSVGYGGVDWLDEAQVVASLDVDYAMFTGGVAFGENTTVTVNAFPVAFHGTVVPDDTPSSGGGTGVDLAWSVREATFASMLSLVPSAYGESFAGVDADGKIAFSGSAKGAYVDGDHLPAFDLAVRVEDGRFKYPDLPTGVTGIGLDLTLTHPGGAADALVVDLPMFAFQTAGAPISGRLHLEHPSTDPDLDAAVQGTLDLAALRSAFPASTESVPAAGKVELDVDVKGRMSAFSEMDTQKVKARGNVVATGVPYVSEGWPQLDVQKLRLSFDGPDATLQTLKVTWPDSDLALSGSLGGLVPYLLTDDGMLTGRLALASTRMDARPFLAAEEEAPAAGPAKGKRKAKAAPAPATAEEAALATVPTNVDLEVETAIGHLVTPYTDLDDVSGTLSVKGGVAELRPMRASMLGGRVTLEGLYGAPTAEGADVDLHVLGVDLDLARTFETFATLRKIAPILANAKGTYGTGLRMRTRLGPDGSPKLDATESTGDVAMRETRVKPQGFGAVAGSLGAGADTVAFAGSSLSYAIRSGRARVQPVEVRLGQLPATLSGSAGVIDGTLDFDLAVQVPTKLLAGTPLGAAAKGGKSDVVVHVGGTYADPKVTVDLAGRLKEIAGEIVDDALARARAEADRILDEAQAQVDRLMDEAEKAAADLRKEAKAQGDKLIRDARGNPAKELGAKEGAKALSKTADKAADKVLGEARKRANALIGEARDRGDALIDAAEKESKQKLR